ncbi:L-fuconolactonase [Chitinophaga skermanii]|uniref:L-fuconolactonase n=1 Tax=Chitinophaga skermanii TaxID=331697 RepID=A0A327QCX1_9BACT|nr:amidohydrolase family protein [Chitinophaga skermanii]RAJ02486.1 L-fuconolactonase [Chitinophaga skermanii]
MQICIDAHQHFWQYHPVKDAWITPSMEVIRRDFTPADIAPIMADNEVHGCVAVQADQSEQETNFLLQLAEQHDIVKGIVGWVDLRADNIVERLQHFAQFPVIKGFRHIVQAEPDADFLLGYDFCRGIAALAKHHFTYDILVYPSQLPAVAAFVKRFPRQPFIIDHLAKPNIVDQSLGEWETNIRAIAEHPNVYCKLSGMVTEADWQNWEQAHFVPFLDVVFDAFGTDRLVYGSDWPVSLLAADYKQVKNIIQQYIQHLPVAEQAKIMGENACRFYNL